MALLSSFSNEQALHLGRLHRIQDLFFPRADDAVFSAWVAVEVSAHGAPAFRIYLNPEANGRTLAPNLVEEALVRLGFGSAWPVIGRTLLRRGPELDELKYFSLDLSSSPEARVKVYARHRNATVEDLELAALGCPTQQHGDVTQF